MGEAHNAMGKAMSDIDEGGKKIHDGLKAGNMMEGEAAKQIDRIWKAKTIWRTRETWGYI